MHTHRSNPTRHRARMYPGPRPGLHCRAGLIQSGVQNVQNGFEDCWCTPFAATGVHPGWHADSGQTCTNLKHAAHFKKHKTTHIHRSNPSRHRARMCPGPVPCLHCRAGRIQSGVKNVQNGFEDCWCTPYAAVGVHPGSHADSGQTCTNLKQPAHSKKHKTTHTHRSNPARHRARMYPGPRPCLH